MSTWHPSGTGKRSLSRAFTLIELLVVVLIVGILLAILLPALKGARALGYQVKEMAAGQHKLVAWSAYAMEQKDAAFTGYIPWAAGHLNNAPGANVWLHPDPWNPTYMVEGNVIKVNGLRWMGATGMTIDELMVHKPTANLFRSRPVQATYNNSGRPPTTLYDSDVGSLPAAMAYHPSLGFNSTYVGGNWHRGAMQGYTPGGGMGHPRPKWYVTETREIRRPSMLMVLCSARGVDIKATGSFAATNYGRNPANWTPAASTSVVPGFWEVAPPRSGYPTNSTVINWIPSNRFDEYMNPADWGFVHPRHRDRAVTVMADGHVEMLSLEQLRDMRRWANKADRPDWTFRP